MAERQTAEAQEPTRETRPQSATAIARRLDPQELIRKAIEQNSGIETIERLVALAKDVRAEQAREAWNNAMAEFQRACPRILKTVEAKIASRSGASYSYKYAPLDEILKKVQPVLSPLGLSVSWRNRIETGKVVANCRISHDFGHFEESGEVVMPIPDENMGATSPQRVGIAMTYAKRYSLLSILGLAPEDDADARGTEPERKIEEPRRASEKAATPQGPAGVSGEARVWVGKIAGVDEKSGKGWKLYAVRGADGQVFSTFDPKLAGFAREAGSSPVRIEWVEVESKKDKSKTYQQIVTIEPHSEVEDREPGSDDDSDLDE